MNSIFKLVKIFKNEVAVLKNLNRYLSIQSSDTDQTSSSSYAINSQSDEEKKPELNILRSLGKKSIELPKLDTEFIKTIETITSFDFSHDAISWIHIEKNGKILDWNFFELDKKLTYNPDFNISFEYLNNVYEKCMPQDSNAYIFEDKRYKAREVKMLQFVLKLQKNEIMFESLIKSKILNQNNKKIFKMNSSKVAKKFNILIGNERVRASDLVQFMIKPRSEIKLDLSSFVLAESDEYYDFFNKAKAHKEPLAINYLQASCFLNLIRDFNAI